ncbi:MAG: TonB-dependent receptor [Calditrichaeota bacterium]|nr:TonB-dependent receptor [Calditrichota bacterium]HQU70695.1 TonB-dependent receptor [Calditrichia bacterium]
MTVFFSTIVCSQTTGKLAGLITDTKGNPLIAANVSLDDTQMGATSDLDGYYLILNLRSGTYTIRVAYLGYQTKVVENVRISADQTTQLNIELAEETIEGDEVVVVAEKPLVEFNVTNQIASVNKDELEQLPLRDLDQIVNLQAGVVDGHFRGGRLGEVQYQVEGVTVNNPYDNASILDLDRSVIEEVQVISGTFDAKYGQAMSGVVNAVLRSGSDRFEWSAEAYGGDHFTNDDLRYPNNGDFDPLGLRHLQLTLSGPTFLPKTTFLISARYFEDEGYLFGERRFMPTDRSDLETPVLIPTGDGEIVPMQNNRNVSGQFKLTNQSFGNIQVSYQAIVNDLEGQRYNHGFRINPEGIKTQHTQSLAHGIDLTHTLSEKVFYKLSIRNNYFHYSDWTYEDFDDPRYFAAEASRSTPNYEDGASIQGVDLGRFEQETNSGIGKFNLTWQADRTNLIEAGLEFQTSEMTFGSPGYVLARTIDGQQTLISFWRELPDFPGLRAYHPVQMASYLQDRLEWGDLVVRGGLRLEYFDARSTIPSDLRNPANAISGAPNSIDQATTSKWALAPRIGLSFPLSSTASIYTSYGHFYQLPGLSNLYNNSTYEELEDLQAGVDNYSIRGNPDLKPEKTVQYEVGLKQALTEFLGLEVSAFYKDIRDLLGVEFITTYNTARYSRFTNVDFGNTYGFTLALSQRAVGKVSSSIDYTLQVARGNSSDPNETAVRADSGKDPRPRDIPFNWDQRHTLNATLVVADPGKYTLSGILKVGSGQPYTPSIGSGFNSELETNSGRKGTFVLMDLRGEKFYKLGGMRVGIFAQVANLFNEFFVNGFVFGNTGTPDYSRFPEVDKVQLTNPSRFYEPRRIEFGLSIRSGR